MGTKFMSHFQRLLRSMTCKDMPDHDQIISMTILMKHVAAVAAKSLQGRIWKKKKNQIAYIDLH